MKYKRFEASDLSIPVEHIFGSLQALNFQVSLVLENCFWYGYYNRHKTLFLWKPQQYISLNLVFIQQIISGRVGSVEGGIIER